MLKKIRNRKRENGDGSIYQKPDGTWRAVLSVGMIGGKRQRRSRNAPTKAVARRKLAELREEARRPFRAVPSLSTADYLAGWLKDVIEPNKSTGTLSSYSGAVNNHIRPHIGNTKLVDLSALHVEGMLSKIDVGQRTKELSFVVLKAALSRAVRLRILDSNPCDAVEKPRSEREEIFPFSGQEVDSILEATEDDRLHSLFVLAFTTGLRQGELFGLRWDDVNLEAGSIQVKQQACEVGGKIEFKPPKTKAGLRSIKLTDRTIEALANRRQIAMKEGNAASELVFTNNRGSVVHRSNFGSRGWRTLLRRLGLKHRGFHHVRHTAITMMLNAGIPIHVVSRVAGHSRVSITLDIYSHMMPDQADDVAEKMGRILG